MKKNIKSITITRNDYVVRNITDEELAVKGHLSQYTEFDIEGRPVKEINYDTEGRFEEMHQYGYDPEGHLVTDSYFPEEELEAETTRYDYNSEGLVSSSSKRYLDGSVDTTRYYYDPRGKLEKKVTISDDGEPDEEEFFSQEEEVIAETSSDPAGNEMNVTRNDNGQIILEERITPDGTVISRVERMYDEEGKPLETVVFIDGQGQRISRHYILHYGYSYYPGITEQTGLPLQNK